MRVFKKSFYAFLCASLLTAALGIQPAYAAGIVVNSADDTVANNGACTLREAITNANADNQSGSTDCAAGAGADAITFAADYIITLVGSQLPAITSEITITGNGAANTILQANAAPNTATYRVLQVAGTGNLTLDGVTVRNGVCNGSCATDAYNGGGMYNAGTATLTNVTFSANTAYSGGGMYNYISSPTLTNVTFSGNSATTYYGGGMYNYNSSPTLTNVTFSANSASNDGGGMANANSSSPTLTNVTFSANSTSNRGGGMYSYNSNPTLTNVTFSANSADYGGGGMFNYISSPTLTNVAFSDNSATTYYGGGMYNYNNSSPTLTNVTFSANSAGYGGGMYSLYSSPTLMNVTFSASSAQDSGGGMYNYISSPTLTNVTFSGNSATYNGGGMYNLSSSPTLTNVIIANSTGGGDCYNNGGALNAASANNLIEDSANACGLTDGSNGNIVGQDPNLDPLANNGGFTQTFALQASSPAIDAGANAGCPADDQRGFLRPIGSACDIGAYEYSSDATFPTVVTTSLLASYVNPGPNAFTVTFSENVADYAGNANPNDVTNPVNYLLVEDGANNAFDTVSCAGGLVADDTQVTVTNVTYNAALYTSSVTLSGALSVGAYRLFVCGTTSIVDPSLNELNNGLSDYIFNFAVTAATPTSTPVATSTSTSVATSTPVATSTSTSVTTLTSGVDASVLPSTGFAPNRITTLPAQPAELAYSAMGDLWLEIPALKVKSVIVGVPQASDKTWNVDWLGANTGWLNGTAFPTWNGNSVLTAHVTDTNGLPGPFAAIKGLTYGDTIIVHLLGQQYIYEVRDTRLSLPASTSYAFKSLQDHSYLTLITCQGYAASSDSYLFRMIVRAVLVEVK